ncbi:hypothetical protein BZG81_08545 [Salinivibrio sp. MA607]|nr:hypothetical protein BZG81_08545 [Salinivibrio sp. MA607]
MKIAIFSIGRMTNYCHEKLPFRMNQYGSLIPNKPFLAEAPADAEPSILSLSALFAHVVKQKD